MVVENFLPGTLERLGWGAERGCWPRDRELVWCTITGFGGGSRRPGYDFVVQAESGWMSITGAPDGEPMKHGVALADVLAGKDAVRRRARGARSHAAEPESGGTSRSRSRRAPRPRS